MSILRGLIKAMSFPSADEMYPRLRYMTRPPRELRWHLTVDLGSATVDGWGREWRECTAGLFSKWLYVEIVQGVDLSTAVFYRWLRIGIPTRGCWRIKLVELPLT